MNSFNERLPEQKHKTLSPLSEEGSPKKQKDVYHSAVMIDIRENNDATLCKTVEVGSMGQDCDTSSSNNDNSESMDSITAHTINNYGYRLLDFCKTNSLFILNKWKSRYRPRYGKPYVKKIKYN